MKKIIITIITFLCIGLYLTNIRASTLSYVETNKTVVDYGDYQKLTIEGKTQEGNLSLANQVMTFASFNKNDNIEMVHWNYNSGTKWTNRNVLALAKDYEEKNPGHKVLAGINGDFFNMASPYEPMDTQITDYEIIRSGYDYFDTVGFDSQNNMVTRRESFSFSSNFYLKVYDDEGYVLKEFKIERSNAIPESNQTSIYTPAYLPDIDCTGQVCYNIKKADYMKSSGSGTDYYYLFKGTIDNMNSVVPALNTQQFTIMTKNAELKEYLDIGVNIVVERKTNSNFDYFRSAGGYSGNIIVNNSISEYGLSGTNGPDHEKERHPRSVLGVTPEGQIIFGAIDGRNNALNRTGVTLKEAAKVLNYYGCTDAIAFDGGGSTTLVMRENDELKVVNHVSNTNQQLRNVCDAWFVVQRDVDIKLDQKLVNSNYVLYDVNVYNKEKITEAYMVLNGKKSKFDINSKELKVEYTNTGKNYLSFEMHYGSKIIKSYCYITDTEDLAITKIPPKDFEIASAEYSNGILNLKFSYLDNADMISKMSLVGNNTKYPIKISTKSASIALEDNKTYYFDIYYEYFDRKIIKKTDSIKWLIVIKDSKCYIVKDQNSIIHYLLGNKLLTELRKNE